MNRLNRWFVAGQLERSFMSPLWRSLKLVAIVAVSVVLSLGLSAAWSDAGTRDSRMPQGNAVTDPSAILQYALPINNPPVRRMQAAIEDIAQQLRGGRRWSSVASDLKVAKNTLTVKRDQLLASIPTEKHAQAEALMSAIQANIAIAEDAAGQADRETVWTQRRQILNQIGDLEALMVGEFPFEIPAEYANLPQLKGRAKVEMETEKGTIVILVDGYNAPITAGNFVDLVQRGFYAGTEVNRAEEYYVVQAGDPPGKADGFIDPETGEERVIPLEIKVRSEAQPVYGATLEEVGLYREPPALPFSAYGTVAMAHRDLAPNTASSQFFFFLFDPELTPAGLNLLDGQYATFGYVVAGEETLGELAKGDKILSARVLEGLEYFVEPSANSSGVN